MKNRLLFVFALFASLALVFGGCESKSEDKKEEKEEEAPEEPTETITFEELDGIKMVVPEGTGAPSKMGGSFMVMGMGLSLVVEAYQEGTHPASVEAAKEEAEGMYSGTNFESETVDNGWIVTWQNEGSLGTNYWVQSKLDVGGKSYWCHTNVANEMQAAGVAPACKTLSK